METWASVAISGKQMKYEASSLGRVRSADRKSFFSDATVKGRVLKQTIVRTGYYSVGIDRISRKVHRLVALAFIPNPDNKPQINHKDGDKLNNCVENLEWCTCQEKIKHSTETGLLKSKLQKEDTLFIRNNYQTMGSAALAKKFGLTKGYIVAVALGRNRKHFGGIKQTKSNWVGSLPIPIIEYDLSGNELNRYTSASQASKMNNILLPRIKEVLLGEKPTCKGKVYKYQNPELAAKYARKPKESTLYMYDLSGKMIDSFLSVPDAADKTGISKYLIRDVLTGRQKKTHGFVFKRL